MLLLLFSHPVMSNSLWLHRLQQARPPCPSLFPEFAKIHVHFISDAIQPSQPPRPSSPLPLIFPSIRDFSNKLTVCIRWPNYQNFSVSISPSSEYSELISFKTAWLDLLTVQGTLRSLLQHYSSKASILCCSAFFIVQCSQLYMITGKTIALTIWTFCWESDVSAFNTLSRFVIAFLPNLQWF